MVRTFVAFLKVQYCPLPTLLFINDIFLSLDKTKFTNYVDKCHLIIANHDNCSVSLDNEIIEGTNTVKLLGIKIDNELKFTVYVSYLCKKGIQKHGIYQLILNSLNHLTYSKVK